MSEDDFDATASMQQFLDNFGAFLEGGRKIAKEYPLFMAICETMPIVLEDSIERIKRYETIHSNLLVTAYWLYCELTKIQNGQKRMRPSQSPEAASHLPDYCHKSAFVQYIGYNQMDMKMAFDQIATAFARQHSGDPSGLYFYIAKEEDVFERLENGDSDG